MNPASDTFPTWSPDGSDIAFVTDRDGVSHIYLMRVDGSAQRRLTARVESEFSPAWSPDGEYIAFSSFDQSGVHLFVIRRDGTGQRSVAHGVSAHNLLWSPDGARIAFESGNSLYLVNADGTGMRRLTDIANVEGAPNYAWSPDSQEILFETITDWDIRLAIIGVDDGALVWLTQGFDPAWTR